MRYRALMSCVLSLSLASAALADGPPQIRPQPFVPRPVSSRTVGVNVLLVSVVVAPANPRRRGFIMFNNSANSTYCCYAATCVAASPTRLIATFTSWEPQQSLTYQGPISCIRNAGAGVNTVYELE